MHALLARLALAALTLQLAPCSARAQGERREGAGLESLATRLAAYVEARASNAGLDDARSALAQSLEELGKTLDGEPLRHTAELGRALWLSRARTGAEERGGKVASAKFAHGSFSGAGMAYAFRLPRDYDASRPYPLILAIPDEGEDPAEHVRAHWTLREFQERVIVVCPAMPMREDWDRVMVKGRPGGLSHVLTGLRVASERFAVDVDRVYVAGRGKGVPAALATGNYSPQRFAGIIGRAGDAGALRPDNFANLPTYFAGAGAHARAFGDAAREAGHDNSRLDVEGTEQDVWIWMLDHPRRPHPERVVLVPGDPFPTRAYWLQISPSAPDARAGGTIERATNTLRIDAQGVALATVFLNDELLDLARPIRVVLNGAERSAVVPRRLASFLDMLHDGTSDATAVYVARAEFDLTGAEATAASDAASEPDTEYAERLASAGSEAAKLWELHLWCASTQRERQDGRVLRALLRADPEHAPARAVRGHVRSATGQWFTSAEALARFERSQDPRVAEAKGHVEFKTLWMHPDERALAVKGWVKDPETGLWLTPADEKLLADGWVRQDLEWIRPEDAPRVDEGLWRVDGEWLDLLHANRRHAALDSMWRIPSAEVLLHSTADREVALRAVREMGRALGDLRRVFGAEPVLPLRVAVLRDEEQYDRFAFGDPDGKRRSTHAGRLHAVHSAFFAESWFPRVAEKHEFMGMGVCIWDTQVPNGDAYGVHAARLAFGLSYVEALDPSPQAVRKALNGGPKADHYAAYQAEKGLPTWLRWGGAVYGERYFEDTTVAPDGDRWWARSWSLENLRSRGGMRELSAILAFELDPDDREDGSKLLLEAGLVVAFIVDGDCAPVKAEHAAFKKALASGRLQPRQVTALTDAVIAHEQELRAFAGP